MDGRGPAFFDDHVPVTGFETQVFFSVCHEDPVVKRAYINIFK